MLKLIGAGLVLAGCVGWSIGGARHLWRRKRILAAIPRALDLMKSEIGSRGTGLMETAQLLSMASQGPVSDFFGKIASNMKRSQGIPFSELWKEAVFTSSSLLLTGEESRELCALGYHLGKFDSEYQEKSITIARDRMAEYAKSAELQCDREWKLQTFVGVAAGLVTVLILL